MTTANHHCHLFYLCFGDVPISEESVIYTTIALGASQRNVIYILQGVTQAWKLASDLHKYYILCIYMLRQSSRTRCKFFINGRA